MNSVASFWNWYDKVKEPWRFILMLLIVSPAFLLLSSGGLPGVFGAIYTLALLGTRIWYKVKTVKG